MKVIDCDNDQDYDDDDKKKQIVPIFHYSVAIFHDNFIMII